MPTVSMVIPTLNASEELPKLLSLLRTQTLRLDEILVIDSSSDDNTVELARSFDGVKVKIIERAAFNHGTTRHLGFLQVKGDYVCFVTQDAIPANEHYLANLIAPLEDPDVVMVSGRQLPKPDARRFEQLVREFNYTSDSNVRCQTDLPKYGIKTFFATDVCSVYKRDAYLACGGFEACNINEDMLMAARFIRAGHKVAYAANAEVFHSHNLSPKQQYIRNKAVGMFLESHTEEFAGVGEIGEGIRLVRSVSSRLLNEGDLLELFSFGVDCLARYLGNRAGRRSARKTRDRQ